MPFLRKYTGPLKTAARKRLSLSAIARVVDAYFNYVTLLLHGDGTNGAQNNTFLADSSTSAFSITRNGNTTQGSFSPYGSNWSNNFNGSSSITAPDSSAFDYGSGDFTLECWIFPTTTNSNVLLTAQTSGGIYGPCNLFFSSGALQLYSSSNNSSFDVASGASVGTPAVNQWSHVAVSRSGTSIRCFLNGTVTSTTTSSATLMNATGTFQIASRNGSEFYSGYVSNFRVVKGTAVYTGSFTPSTTPLTAISGTSLLTCADNRFLDDSTNNFTITANGTPSVQRFNPFGAFTAYSTAVIGGSGYFPSGASQGSSSPTPLAVPGNSSFNLSGDFTFEVWHYGDSYTYSGGNNVVFLGADYGVSINQQIGLTTSNNAMQVYHPTTGVQSSSTLSGILGAWNHYAYVRSGSTITFYFNGVNVGSVTNSQTFTMSNGAFGALGGYGGRPAGYLTDLRLNSTALYSSNFTPPTAPISAISGTTCLLSFTNGAIFDNAMMNDLETVGNAQISTSVKKYGTGSLAFDGTGDYLSTASTPNLAFGSGDFTIECWVYASSLGSYNAVFAQWPDNGGTINNSYTLETVGSNMEFYWASSAGIHGPATLGTITTGEWIHYAICRSGNTLYPFKNGVLGTTTSINQTLNSPTSAVTVGGQVAGAGYWNGYIDDLRITKGYARYTTTFTPPAAAFLNIGL